MHTLVTALFAMLAASWEVFQEASAYIIFGLLVGGLLKVFITPSWVASHLGRGRFLSVLKAAVFGVPIPLCSCGVLPAAASLKKQGANNGATLAFLISTPESGVDSISISWALLDPIMTVVRPLAAFVSACTAGMIENLRKLPEAERNVEPDLSCPIDRCCEGTECSPEEHRKHHSFHEKVLYGVRFAVTDLWGDIAGSFIVGTLLAGVIYVVVPDDFFLSFLGGGLPSMLLMLLLGIPLYICATASTPLAAAFILKGVSPGAALVFLLVGPATNIMSVSVLISLFGKRTTGVYLATIAVVSVLFGLGLDEVYTLTGISPQASIGTATELIPIWLKNLSAVLLIVLSLPLFWKYILRVAGKKGDTCTCSDTTGDCCSTGGKNGADNNSGTGGCSDVHLAGFPGTDKQYHQGKE